MRIDPYYLDKNNIKHPDRIYIMSKQRDDGWLTVDSKTLNRN